MKRDKWKYQLLAFSKQTPTAFIVESPFQLLCAWNAIEEFEIKEYKIILAFERSNIRNVQTMHMLDERGMEYEILYEDECRIPDILEGKMQRSQVRYDRIMAGEILNDYILAVCGLYASDNSVVVYMDDGAATIRVLTGHSFNQSKYIAKLKQIIRPKAPMSIFQASIRTYWTANGLHDYGFMYTIYSDIKTNRYITYPNKLDFLRTKAAVLHRDRAIIIIGALTDGFAKTVNISIAEYEAILRRKLQEIRGLYPNEHIIYIPHGRDNNENVKEFCSQLDIEYHRLDKAVEYYVIMCDMEIVSVYGFSSTALYTLKLITGVEVTNWLIVNKLTPAWFSIMEIASYYKRHGITIDKISYPQSIDNTIKYYIARIRNFLKHK